MRKLFLLLEWLSLSVLSQGQNLVAYYPFNGNPNDQSGNAINPTYVGSGVTLTSDRFGNANQAYYFDGTTGPNYSVTGSYMRMPASSLPATNRTISLWFYTNDVSNMPGLLGYGGNSSCGTTLLMGLNCTGAGQYWVQGHCGANQATYAYSTAPINNWYHWVLTINGSAQKIYINGELKSTSNTFSGSTATAGVDLAVGSITHTNGLSPYTDVNVGFFKGKLDDIRIYDNALTDAQILQLYKNESTGLVAYYPFNGNANDESGNSNNSTYIGSGVTLTADRFGNANKAYNFDGAVGSYIRIPADNFPATDRTISFWFNADRLDYYVPTPFSYGGNVCNNSLLMIINHYNYTNSYLVESHCGANAITAPYTVEPVNKWYHLTLTINGSTQKIFVNGVLQQSTNSFTSPTYVTGTSALVGACINTDGNSAWAGFFKGKLDEFRIYNIAMTDAQVLALHTTGEGTTPMAYYPFNGNANDESGNGFNGTVSGATLSADRFNQSGKAYNFVYNGFSSDKIQVPGTSNLNFSTGGFSLSAWVQFSGTAGAGNNYPIVSKHNCGEQSGYILMLYNDKLTFWLAGAGGYNVVTTPDNYTDGKWHHVVAVYDGSTQYIYADGVLKNSAALAYTNFNTANWALGGYNGCNGGFNGKVDEIKVFDRPITDGEIQKMYTQSTTDMVAYYPFNGNANDESGNDNNGVTTGATLTTDRFGNSNKAFHFNGVNNFISVADNPDLFSDELTLSWWYKVPDYSGTRVVIGWVSGGNRYQQFFSNNSLAYFNGYYNNCCYINPTYSNMTIVNQWQHVAVTYKKTNTNESVTRLYINGELKQTDNHAAAITYQPGATFFIGKTHDGGYFNGELDEIRVYKRVLSPNEILQLAELPVMPELRAYYPLNGNTSDMSGNGYHGTTYSGNSTADRYGNNNSAYSFPALSDKITLDNSTGLNFNTGFSFSSWIKYSNISQRSSIVAKHNCGIVNGFVWLVENNQLRLYIANGSAWDIVGTTETYNDSKWHHAVVVYDGAGNVTVYVDGSQKATGSVGYNNYSTAPLTIGNVTGSCGEGNFSGSIDEVKIYGAALDTAQIKALYKQSRGSGQALTFLKNSTNHVSIGTINPPPSFTIEAWIKKNAASGSLSKQYLFAGKNNNSWGFGVEDNVSTPNRLFLEIIGGTISYGPSMPNLTNDNKWHHVSVRYVNAASPVLFTFDGIELTGSSNITAGSTTGEYSIGSRFTSGNSLDGSIDELRLWGTALSLQQIRDWKNRKISGNHPANNDLTYYYNFDEPAIAKVYDSRSGATGLLIDGPAFITSGASLGDASTHNLNNPSVAAVLSLASGESLTIEQSAGTALGVSIYEVKDPPENQAGILGLGRNDYYFGVDKVADYSGGTTASYNLTYNYNGNPYVSSATESTLLLFKRTDNSAAAWTNSGATLNTIDKTLTVNGQNTEYILGSSGFALPVTLTSFQVQKISSTTAKLTWQTATELNNKGFAVQRSFDGMAFKDLAFVTSAGNSTSLQDYSYNDVPGFDGRVYYRVAQQDQDGNRKYSNIISVWFDRQDVIRVYPNPANSAVTIENIGKYERIQVLNERGQVVKEVSNNNQPLLVIDISNFKSGLYLLRCIDGADSRTIKLAVNH